MDEEDGATALGKIISHNPDAVVIVISSVAGQDIIAKGGKKSFCQAFKQRRIYKVHRRIDKQLVSNCPGAWPNYE
jgi:hypothetical protein